MTKDSTTTEATASETKNKNNSKDGLRHDDPGLAHLNQSFQLSRQQEQDLLEDARRRRALLLQNDCQEKDDSWSSRVNYHGVAVASKKETGNPFCITKGICEAPNGLTVDIARRQYEHDFKDSTTLLRTFNRIDPMNLYIRKITDIQNTDLLDTDSHELLRIIWASFYVAPLISDRDFLLAMHTSTSKCPITGHTVFCSNTFSVELPDAVPNDLYDATGRVRALVQLTGYIFRPYPATPEDGRLQMAFVGQCDPKGLLPVAIVNLASVSQAMNVGRVRDSYEHFRQVVEEFKVVKHDFPLGCFSLPRRGGSVTHRIPIIVLETTATTSKEEEKNKQEGCIRLLVHCDHSITVQATEGTNGCVVESVTSELKGKGKLADGEPVTFGGKGELVLDLVLQVALKDNDNDQDDAHYLELLFTNHCWTKATVCFPATLELAAAASSLDKTAAAESVEQ